MTVKAVIILILLSALLLTTGCLQISADELYSLPAISEEYVRLQAQINLLISQGAEFLPPTGGPNRQAIQLRDLTGNGTNEVIAFFSVPGDSALRIYIFELIDGDYTVAAVIEGVGTEIESIRYVDMDGNGTVELAVGWQMGPALKFLSIYSIDGFYSQLLVSGAEYSEIAVYDLTGDGGQEIVLFRLPTFETGAAAEIYRLMSDGEIIRQDARLSSFVESISSIQTGLLSDGTPAIFVDSDGSFIDGSLVTDIFAMRDNSFTNITLDPMSGVSNETVRHRMSSTDINGDGIIMVPALRRLIQHNATEYYALDWYAFGIDGSSTRMLTTYHNIFDEWFLILPDDWRDSVSVKREDGIPGERTIIFSYNSQEDATQGFVQFLSITRLSGENVYERATRGNREILAIEGNTVFAYEFFVPENSFGLTFNEAMINENFRLIFTEWLS